MNSFPQIIQESNSILASLKKEILDLNIPSFNFENLRNSTFSQACDITVSHRIVSKYDLPGSNHTRDVAYASFISYEQELKSRPQICHLWDTQQSPQLMFRLRRARCELSKILTNYSKYYDASRVEYTVGESYFTGRGDTSIDAKLSNLRQWTCTSDVIDDVLWMLYHNRGLKTMARRHIRQLGLRMVRKYKGESAIAVFNRCAVRLLTVVPGARGATVPKNTKTDRFINIEPTFNMLLQRTVAHALRACLRDAGHTLGSVTASQHSGWYKPTEYADAQELHKKLIQDFGLATIDFSNASDSTLIWACRLLFPQDVYCALKQYRSNYVRIQQNWIKPVKLSSMGNGFTFEVMTCLLLAIGRVFSGVTRVFGDDVIIPKEYADDFIETVGAIGYTTNPLKTFTEGNFRESCGSFRHIDGEVTSYEFTYISSFVGCIVSGNKLGHILTLLPSDSRLHEALSRAHRAFSRVIPLRCKGGVFDLSNLGTYFYDPKSLKKRRDNTEAASEWAKVLVNCERFLQNYQIDTRTIEIVHVPTWVQRKLRCKNPDLTSLYSMRSISRKHLRGKGRWCIIPCILLPNGNLIRVACARRGILSDLESTHNS